MQRGISTKGLLAEVMPTFNCNGMILKELPNFDRPTTKMGHYNGTTWESLSGTLAGSNPYTYAVNGVISFSPFAILNNSLLGTSNFEVASFKLYPNPSNGEFTIQTTQK